MSEQNPQQIALEIGKLLGDRLAVEIRASEQRTADRIEKVHDEVSEIREHQHDMSVSLARMDTRLNEGDKRFEALEDRVEGVEERERKASVGWLKLIGGGALGALGTYLAERLGKP